MSKRYLLRVISQNIFTSILWLYHDKSCVQYILMLMFGLQCQLLLKLLHGFFSLLRNPKSLYTARNYEGAYIDCVRLSNTVVISDFSWVYIIVQINRCASAAILKSYKVQDQDASEVERTCGKSDVNGGRPITRVLLRYEIVIFFF